MEARTAEVLPSGDDWQYRAQMGRLSLPCLQGRGCCRSAREIGQAAGPLFPGDCRAAARGRGGGFVVDGELVIAIDGRLSFDALQMRLHPAESRIRKLAAETPARLSRVRHAGGAGSGADLIEPPRRAAARSLEAFVAPASGSGKLVLSPCHSRPLQRQAWLERRAWRHGWRCRQARWRRLTTGRARHGQGEAAAGRRTASSAAFATKTTSREVGSLLLGLYDARGKLDHVGFTARRSRTRNVPPDHAARDCGAAGFTGNAPGGPSRWSTERSGRMGAVAAGTRR